MRNDRKEMPGGQGFEEVEENKYKGSLKVKVGPVQGVFDANIILSDVVAPESYTIEADGKSSQGYVKAKGSLKLSSQDGKTHMDYVGTAQISGRIASVGQRLIDSSARSIIRQSLEGLNEYLKVQVATASASDAEVNTTSAGETTPAYKPPSQTRVALTVMRDVFNDTIPSRWQPIFFIAVLIVIVVLVWILFL
ncbi:MAG: carbon monoxide dehydrogenase subunit G [Chloroflexi bacterium]|nr:carbon monoxide dehydrogenase subunit G [Chloroflexota bacterium]